MVGQSKSHAIRFKYLFFLRLEIPVSKLKAQCVKFLDNESFSRRLVVLKTLRVRLQGFRRVFREQLLADGCGEVL